MVKYFISFVLCCNFLFANNDTLAISYFDNTSNLKEYDAFSKGLADMLITDLSKVKSLQIVEREKLESLLKEINLGDGGFIDASTAQKMGQGLGAKYILTGGFFIMDNVMRIDARLIEVETGVVIMAEKINGEKNTFFSLEKELAKKLIDALAISTSRSEQIALKRTSTKSFDAMLAYSSGLNESDLGEYQAAMSSMEKALELDDEFEKAAYKLEDLDSLIKTLSNVRSVGLSLELVSLIESIDINTPSTCREFDIFYTALISPHADPMFGGSIPDSIKVEDWEDPYYENKVWRGLGITNKPENYDEFIMELGKKYYTIYQMFKLVESKGFNDSACGSINPNKIAIERFLDLLHMLDRHLVEPNTGEHNIVPDMINQGGDVVIDAYAYPSLYIEIGTDYIKRFPFGEQFQFTVEMLEWISGYLEESTELDIKSKEKLKKIQDWLYQIREGDIRGNIVTTYSNSLSKISKIDTLHLFDTNTSTVPPEIEILTNLKVIDLSDTDVLDLPDEIKNLKDLSVIDLRCPEAPSCRTVEQWSDTKVGFFFTKDQITEGIKKASEKRKLVKKISKLLPNTVVLYEFDTPELEFTNTLLDNFSEGERMDRYLRRQRGEDPYKDIEYDEKGNEILVANEYYSALYDIDSIKKYRKGRIEEARELAEEEAAKLAAAAEERRLKEEEKRLREEMLGYWNEKILNKTHYQFGNPGCVGCYGEQYFGTGDYANKKQNGLWTYYYEDGSVRAKGYYVNGSGDMKKTRRNSITGEMLDDNDSGEGIKDMLGRPIEVPVITEYGSIIPKDGRDGEWVFYYPDGIIEEITNYSNGILNGPFVFYDDDGEVRQKGNYVNGYRSR